MGEQIQPIQGMSDICGGEVRLWRGLETRARLLFDRYGFEEIRTPVLEYADLFTRAVGETTSVVRKEMYTLEKGGRHFALRPEGTAGVMRHAAGLGGQETEGARWYYLGPMFRHERPQAGRKRQFHQCGVECMEPPSPAVDAEIIALQLDLLRTWGMTHVVAKVNTRGAGGDHQRVAEGLAAALAPHKHELCEDCQRRMDENILRVLDCKNPACGVIVAALPPVTHFMSDTSRAYLNDVFRHLDRMGVPYEPAPLLVRGLDYYEHTIWEVTGAQGAQDALAGGGRYRMQIGKREMAGVGFAVGMERVLGVLMAEGGGADAFVEPLPDLICLVGLGDAATDAHLPLLQTLRNAGLAARMARGGSMKSQMRSANKMNAAWAVIRGETELAAGTAVVKNMISGEQREVPLAGLPDCFTA